MIVLDSKKLERALEAIEVLNSAGLDAKYVPEYDSIVIRPEQVLENAGDYEPESKRKEVVESNTVSLQSLVESATSDLITLGERIRERKLSSYFERQNLRRAGTLARNLYKDRYGKNPDRNSKKTLVYPKTDVAILDEAINTMMEKMSSKESK